MQDTYNKMLSSYYSDSKFYDHGTENMLEEIKNEIDSRPSDLREQEEFSADKVAKYNKEKERLFDKYDKEEISHKEYNEKTDELKRKYGIEKEKVDTTEKWTEKDKREYDLYKRAKENPDSIDPMTENSTDWDALDKKWSNRYDYDKEQEEFGNQENNYSKMSDEELRDELDFNRTMLNEMDRRLSGKYDISDEQRQKLEDRAYRYERTKDDIRDEIRKRKGMGPVEREFGTKTEAQVERFKERKGKDLGINITEAPSRASQKTGLKAEPYKKELDRTVELGLSATSYTAGKDAEILDSISGQLSDGIWENSNMDRYWKNMDFVSENGNIKMATGSRGWYPDYSSYGGYRGGYSNPFSEKDDSQIRTYIADKAKQIVKKNIDDNPSLGKWSRDNTNRVEYMGGHGAENVTVADVYSFYDRVKGRPGKKYNTYGKTSVAKEDVDNIKAKVERYKKRKNK